MAVILKMRAASGRVDHHLRVVARERVDVQPSELSGALALAGVRMQSAAAGLLLGNADDVAIAFEQAHGGALRVSERFAHDAAGEDAHVGALTIDSAEGRALRRRRQ